MPTLFRQNNSSRNRLQNYLRKCSLPLLSVCVLCSTLYSIRVLEHIYLDSDPHLRNFNDFHYEYNNNSIDEYKMIFDGLTAQNLNPAAAYLISPESNSTALSQTTGSFSNCKLEDKDLLRNWDKIFSTKMYTGVLQVSCKLIGYRVSNKFQNAESIITGVLSKNSNKGEIRRDSIRSTWANGHENVYFIVAGPWDDIEHEFRKYGDLLWIDEKEVYNGEESVLTLKTYSFIAVVGIMASKFNFDFTHIFKTDDDSYVDLHALRKELFFHNRHYIGHCQKEKKKVIRDASYKWSMSIATYPEEYFPKYCQGAGFALSRNFVSCAYSQRHIAETRFMPLEDVAVGILAERCAFDPTESVTGEIKLSRFNSMEARESFNQNDKKQSAILVPLFACMTARIVQHRVIDEHDMEELHKTVKDPKYCKITGLKRAKIIEDLDSKEIKWFG